MKFEDMDPEIPLRVREALAAAMRGLPCYPNSTLERIQAAIRAKPKTVRMPAADIPAPLTEVPNPGQPIWMIDAAASESGVSNVTHCGTYAERAIALGLAWDTREKAEAALAAFTAREGEA